MTRSLALISLTLTALSHAADPVILRSDHPSKNWEQAFLGGNGNQGVMVLGKTHDETIVINHTKCWVPAQPVKPDIPDIAAETARSRELAKEGKFEQAGALAFNAFGDANKKLYPAKALIRSGPRFGLNYVHPAAHLKIKRTGGNEISNYSRSLELDTGEIKTSWTDSEGDWTRSVFVSRPDNVTVIRFQKSARNLWNGDIQLAERHGYDSKDIAPPIITKRDDGMYLKTHYKHKHGLSEADGYHTMIRVVPVGGESRSAGNGVSIEGADEVLVFLRTEYLPVYSKADEAALRKSLDAIPADYDQLLARHAKIHGEMFRRVRLDLGGNHGKGRSTESIIAEAEKNGPTPAYLELIHASGRYLLISSSGDLPPTLMGIWGDTWKPEWWGHYTLDSNLQLAVANGNVGNLPEAMESFFSWIETLYPDWERNAQQLYGSKGYLGAIAHGWRHGLGIAGWNEWTGCAAWIATFHWQQYLFTGDEVFLRERTVPLLENIMLFYENFLPGSEGPDGKFFIYPSTSPENRPSNIDNRTAPNATSEIALIHETITALTESYRILGINQDRIPKLEAFRAKLPDYRINKDGALAEWAHPEVEDNYNHRHNSHLIALYPGVSINPKTPELYEAAKIAIAMRRKSGQGNKSAHGYMELGFVGSRLQSPEIVWTMLNDYATEKFIHPSFVSSHNPNKRIYNLDSILALPAIFTEMCVYSRPGTINLLPGLPEDKLPKGSISGILARKAIVIDDFSWDLGNQSGQLKLTSKEDQTIVLTSRLGVRKVEGDGASKNAEDQWTANLKAGKTTDLKLSFGKN